MNPWSDISGVWLSVGFGEGTRGFRWPNCSKGSSMYVRLLALRHAPNTSWRVYVRAWCESLAPTKQSKRSAVVWTTGEDGRGAGCF